jgi:tape measure domain-containing protein
MVKGALPALGVAGAVAAGGNILNKGMDREVQVSNFQQFIPDTKLANQTFSNLNQWGNDTIYKNSDVLKVGAKVAEQFGAARVMPQMKMYGDLAGGNAEDLAGIARTMGQIKGVGRLQGDELNELANHGILGLQEEIAKLKGVSLSAFYQMKEKGLISFQDVQKAMERMTGEGGKYFGRLDRMSQTTFGRVQKLWGTIEES